MTEYKYDEKIRLSELQELVNRGLGHSLDDDTFSKLADIQLRMQTNNDTVSKLLELKYKMTKEECLNQFNDNAKKMMTEALELLGEEKFLAIFGETGLHPEGLIDREIFLGSN